MDGALQFENPDAPEYPDGIERKVVSIVQCGETATSGVIALCDDGTVWKLFMDAWRPPEQIRIPKR